MTELLIHVSRKAMACQFEVRFPADRYEQGTEASINALDLVEVLEQQLSYFRPMSELNRVNRLAAEGPVEVTRSLFELLELATRLCEETAGAYDITAAPLWEAWGFARRAGRIPSDVELAEARSLVGGSLVELDPDRRTVYFRKPGIRINLGSIGKGHAVDACGDMLLASGVADFLVHGGQSSVLGVGCAPVGAASADLHSPLPAEESGGNSAWWEIGIRDPRQPSRRLAVVRLNNRALGTSGVQFQSFRHQGRRLGHILDPRSGLPAEGLFSTTVVAPTAALADALSTAFYVMGPEQSLDYCRRHTEIGVVMICPGPQDRGIEIHTAGLDEQELDQLDLQDC
jgi:FAD:protein FMN transferase